MADVPGESDHGPCLGIHYRVLNDVGLACHVAGQKLFCPTWHAAGFGQESTGNEAIFRSNLPKDDVFCQHMVTTEKRSELLGTLKPWSMSSFAFLCTYSTKKHKHIKTMPDDRSLSNNYLHFNVFLP